MSQRSHVREELKDELSLPTASKETLMLNTFGSDTFRPLDCSAVKLFLETEDKGSVEIRNHRAY